MPKLLTSPPHLYSTVGNVDISKKKDML